MPRSHALRAVAAAVLLVAFAGAPLPAVRAASPQESSAKPASQDLTPEQRMTRRYPQPVKVGALIGLPVLDQNDSTYGYIRAVVRMAEGKIVLIVPYRNWLGWAPTDWGRKTVAVPIEAVAMLGHQVAALDFSRAEFAAAPAYAAKGTALPADATIRIAVTRR